MRIADVNGRLPVPILALSEIRFEITPMAWPMRFTVIPRVFVRRTLRRTGSANKASDQEREKMAASPHVPSNKQLQNYTSISFG